MSYGWRRVDGQVVEICDECGFDSRRVVALERDLSSVMTVVETLLADPAADRRPTPEVWSAVEYVEHCVEITVDWCREIAAGSCLSVSEPATSCLGARELLGQVIAGLVDPGWDSVWLPTPFGPITARGALLHVLHDVEHHVLDVRRGYARLALACGEDMHTNVR